MLERGLLPDFSPTVLAELDRLQPVDLSKWEQFTGSGAIRDMRNLFWASIDNDDSHDLDQLSAAEALPNGEVKILVAVADVDALVKNGSAIEEWF